MVLGGGLEPPRIAPHGPQPCASANSATRAVKPSSSFTRSNNLYAAGQFANRFAGFFQKKSFTAVKMAIEKLFKECFGGISGEDQCAVAWIEETLTNGVIEEGDERGVEAAHVEQSAWF